MLPSQSEPCFSPIGNKGHFIMLPLQSEPCFSLIGKKDTSSCYHHSHYWVRAMLYADRKKRTLHHVTITARDTLFADRKKGHFIMLPLQSEPWFSPIGKKGHFIMLPSLSEPCLFTAERKGVNRRRVLICPGVAGPCATRPCQCRSTRSRGYPSVVRVRRLSLTAAASGGTQVGREDWGFVRATVCLRCSMHPLAVRHRLNDITFAVD